MGHQGVHMAGSLHQTLLMVSALEASVAFYRDVVGLSVGEDEEGNVEFETGESTLVLESDFDQEVLDSFGLEHPGEERGMGVIVAIEVADVGAVYDRARAADVTVRMEPREVPWGRRMMLLSDPDGYVVEVSRPL